MKINSNKPVEGRELNLNTQNVERLKAKGSARAAGKTRLTDKIDISSEGKKIAELMAAVGQLPEVRTEMVNSVKEAIESGNYKIDSPKIAEKILSEL